MIPIKNKAVKTKGMGRWFIYATIMNIAWSYKRTIWFLLRKKGLKSLLNFLYVKIFVPAGEGHGGAFYFLVGPIIRKFPILAPFPKYVEIEVTTKCPYRCVICEHTYWKDQEEKHLSFIEFKHIVDQFPGLKWTNITGEGEAFFNPDYMKMIEYLKSNGTCVYLVDTFDKMDGGTSRDLIEMGVDGIYLSIDAATQETYERIKVGCKFDRVITNLKNFIELKKKMGSPIPELCIRYTLTKYNVNEIPKFMDLMHSLGKREDFGDGSRIDFGGLLEFNEIEHLRPGDIPENIIDQITKKRKEYNLRFLFQHTEGQNNPPVNCCIFWMEPYVMMGGYVLPCCQVLMSNKRAFLRGHAFGNIFEKPMKEIWNSQRYKEFRKSVTDDKVKLPLFCKGCRAFNTKYRERIGIDERL